MMPSWMTPDQRGKGLYADYLFNAIAGNWERKRPVWVMLMVNSLTEADIKTRGVPVLDLYLAQEAERMRKRTGAVEKVEEQCHPLNGLNFSQVSSESRSLGSPEDQGLQVCLSVSHEAAAELQRCAHCDASVESPAQSGCDLVWGRLPFAEFTFVISAGFEAVDF